MNHFQSLFGIYEITVKAKDKIEAKELILKKFNSYKDGSKKKEYIRNKLNMIEPVTEVRLINGFWR